MSDFRVTKSLHNKKIVTEVVFSILPFKGQEKVFLYCTVLMLIQCPTPRNSYKIIRFLVFGGA